MLLCFSHVKILHRKIVTIEPPIRYVLQRLASLYTLLEHPFWGCLGCVMVKDVRRCSARRARRIRGLNPRSTRSTFHCFAHCMQSYDDSIYPSIIADGLLY